LGENFLSPIKNGPKMALIWGNGGLNVRFYDRDPEKAHPCAEPRVLAYFASKSIKGLGCSELQEPKTRSPAGAGIANRPLVFWGFFF